MVGVAGLGRVWSGKVRFGSYGGVGCVVAGYCLVR